MIRISKWSETFENADSRKRQRLGYYYQPSGCDSAGYVELMSYGVDGLLAYGLFVAICQWSATCSKDIRGTIARSDGAEMSLRHLAAVLRISVELVEKGVPLLCHPDVGWLVNENAGETVVESAAENNISDSSAGDVPLICQSHPKNSPIVQGQGQGQGQGQVNDDSKSSGVIAGHFQRFWDAFDLKADRKTCEPLFAKMVKSGADPELIIERAAVYSAACRETDTKQKYPQGWLNAERWNDEHLPTNEGTRNDRPELAVQRQENAQASVFDKFRAAAAAQLGESGGATVANIGTSLFNEEASSVDKPPD